MKLIEIYNDEGMWAGNGTVDEYGSIECSAVLYPNNEDNYDKIEEAIQNGEFHGKVNGYEWVVRDRI